MNNNALPTTRIIVIRAHAAATLGKACYVRDAPIGTASFVTRGRATPFGNYETAGRVVDALRADPGTAYEYSIEMIRP